MKYLGLSVTAIVLLLFMTVNIYASQRFSGLFYRLVAFNDIAAAKEFLQKIKGSPLYTEQYKYLNGMFQNGLVQEKLAEDQKNYATKEYYRSMLERNPKSRDALVALALYELHAGNLDEAARFYTQAKEVDPWLKITSLE